MRTILMLSLLAWVAPGPGFAVEPRRPGQDSFLIRAVFAQGRLWLLSDAGVLSSLSEGETSLNEEPQLLPALDLCVRDGVPMVVTCRRESCGTWTLRRWSDGKWLVQGTVSTEHDEFVGLHCGATGATLLTSRRLIEVGRDKQTSVVLSEPLPVGLVASIHVTPAQVLVGINAGEWGGGLRRIERGTGKVTVLERNDTGDLCGGPLNSECDPVNAIAVEPWKPDCVAVAVGLVHFESHGRIVEVCGEHVQRLDYKPYGDPRYGRSGLKGDEPVNTVAFFGLARIGNALWAAGNDGVYRVEERGAVRVSPLPHFKEIGGIRVNFGLPNLVLVLTNVNQRRSVSGSVPMLVPR